MSKEHYYDSLEHGHPDGTDETSAFMSAEDDSILTGMIPPKTPRQAAEQSARFVGYVRDRENGYDGYRAQIQYFKFSRKHEQDELSKAEGAYTFASNYRRALEEINEETDPSVIQTLWEDLLSLETVVVKSESDHARLESVYNAKDAIIGRLEETCIPELLQDIVATAVNEVSTDAQQEKTSEPLLGILESVVWAGVRSSNGADGFDTKQTYLEVTSQLFVKPPRYTTISKKGWDKISETVRYMRELDKYESGEPVSLALSHWLTGFSDVLTSYAVQNQESAQNDLNEKKTKPFLTDEDIAQHARRVVDGLQQPLLEQAKNHVEENLDLLRRAAIAEAALDGVDIKTDTSSKK